MNTSTGAANLISQFAGDEEVVGLYILPPAAKDGAPAAVSGLSVSFEEGKYNGTVSFTMPATTYGGSALSGNINYIVKFSDEVKATGTAAAGSDVTVEIKGVSPAMHTISVVASNEVGDGGGKDNEVDRERHPQGRDKPDTEKERRLIRADPYMECTYRRCKWRLSGC